MASEPTESAWGKDFRVSKEEALLDSAKTCYQKGEFEQALILIKEASSAFHEHDQHDKHIDCLLLEGRIHRDKGDFSAALTCYQAARVMAEEAKTLAQLVDALNLIASVIRYQGNHDEAIGLLKNALSIATKEGFTEQKANLSNNIGNLYVQVNDYPKALQYLTEANDQYRQIGFRSRDGAVNHLTLGSVYLDLGEFNKAQSFFEKALEISQQTQSLSLIVVALNNLAEIYAQQALWPTAQEYYQEALLRAQDLGAKHYEIDNLDGLGQTFAALRSYDKALDYHRKALTIAQEIDDHEGQKDALYHLGRDHLELGQDDLARDYLQQALTLAGKLGHKKTLYECHHHLSQLYKQQADYARALEHYENYHAIERSIFNEESEEKTRQLSVKFDLERARFEAEEYKIRSEFSREARRNAHKLVNERTRELENAQLEIVTRLAIAAEYRDDDTGEHTRRVGRNAAAIAHVLGWPENKVQLIYLASRLHDIGKIGIKDGILLKPGKLTNDEFELMRGHTVIGARILSDGDSALLQLAEKIALSHHERWDGQGYPYRLAGEEIPMSARIVSVADVLDALTHERPYKRAWTVEETLVEIKSQSGKQFDPAIVKACMNIFETGHLSPLQAPDSWPETIKELNKLEPLSLG